MPIWWCSKKSPLPWCEKVFYILIQLYYNRKSRLAKSSKQLRLNDFRSEVSFGNSAIHWVHVNEENDFGILLSYKLQSDCIGNIGIKKSLALIRFSFLMLNDQYLLFSERNGRTNDRVNILHYLVFHHSLNLKSRLSFTLLFVSPGATSNKKE